MLGGRRWGKSTQGSVCHWLRRRPRGCPLLVGLLLREPGTMPDQVGRSFQPSESQLSQPAWAGSRTGRCVLGVQCWGRLAVPSP